MGVLIWKPMPEPVLAPAPRRAARLAGRAGLALTGSAVAAVLLLCLAGPSAAVPALGGDGPPWSFSAAPAATPVILLCAAAIVAGALGTGAGLYALRRGWRPAPGPMLAVSAAAVLALVLVPPAGSTDVLNYAVYGRIAALGHDPYVTAPAWLHAVGDPVGAFAPPAWRNAPSVYGPVATWAQQAASWLGGASMARTVFAWKAMAGLAFLLSALLLDRLAGPGRARRVRAHLLWSLNPLMLWHVVAGGHVDGLGTLLLLGAFLAARRGDLGTGPRGGSGGRGGVGGGVGGGLVAGVLLGAAAAVKAPFALAGAGLFWVARRSPATLAATAAGTLAALAAAYATRGPEALANVAGKVASRALADPWRVVAAALGEGPEAAALEGRLALGAAVLAAALLCLRLPAAPSGPLAGPLAGPQAGLQAGLQAVRPALACCLGWLLTSPMQHPWYDALLFPLLALMPACRLDGLMLVRGVVTSLVYLPGAVGLLALPPAPLVRWAAEVYRPWVAPLASDVVIACVVALALAGRLGARPLPPGPALPAGAGRADQRTS
ncbi:polyprenol phosphomannose-dependent alpha 1,6 mannosyltransferase MptB [Streptosporangium sandarakinum]|uniref:polyprenol phosphomannose-dependent alpha 1,6 mannosyltransferase MptB n=1 Tax=Streptosporangium sandarakinum TaxID=1260955 RepID=UPI0037A3FF2A